MPLTKIENSLQEFFFKGWMTLEVVHNKNSYFHIYWHSLDFIKALDSNHKTLFWIIHWPLCLSSHKEGKIGIGKQFKSLFHPKRTSKIKILSESVNNNSKNYQMCVEKKFKRLDFILHKYRYQPMPGISCLINFVLI